MIPFAWNGWSKSKNWTSPWDRWGSVWTMHQRIRWWIRGRPLFLFWLMSLICSKRDKQQSRILRSTTSNQSSYLFSVQQLIKDQRRYNLLTNWTGLIRRTQREYYGSWYFCTTTTPNDTTTPTYWRNWWGAGRFISSSLRYQWQCWFNGWGSRRRRRIKCILALSSMWIYKG